MLGSGLWAKMSTKEGRPMKAKRLRLCTEEEGKVDTLGPGGLSTFRSFRSQSRGYKLKSPGFWQSSNV